MGTWDTVVDGMKSVAPSLAASLLGGGPLGALAAGALKEVFGLSDEVSPEAVQSAISSASPEIMLQLRLAEQSFLLEKTRLELAAATSQIEAVNATIRVEAASEHFIVYGWRPIAGLTFVFTLFGNYFLLPLLRLPPALIPPEVPMVMGAILGIDTLFRGRALADPTNTAVTRG